MIGNIVTSNSCCGTCLIFSSGAPAERERGRQRGGLGRPATSRRARRGSASSVDGRSSVDGHGHAASSVGASASSAGWPVSARNTSSRLGWPSANSPRAIPHAGQLGQAPRGTARRRRRATVKRGRVGLGLHLGVEAPPSSACRGRPPAPRRDRTCSVPGPTEALSSPLVPSAMTRPWSMIGDAVGELVGLVEVLRREQHRRALADEHPHDLPHLVAAAGIEAGGGLVEEEQVGRDDEAGGDVEAPAHAAGVRP